eukprot:5273147-Amphidinium_carterae.1
MTLSSRLFRHKATIACLRLGFQPSRSSANPRRNPPAHSRVWLARAVSLSQPYAARTGCPLEGQLRLCSTATTRLSTTALCTWSGPWKTHLWVLGALLAYIGVFARGLACLDLLRPSNIFQARTTCVVCGSLLQRQGRSISQSFSGKVYTCARESQRGIVRADKHIFGSGNDIDKCSSYLAYSTHRRRVCGANRPMASRLVVVAHGGDSQLDCVEKVLRSSWIAYVDDLFSEAGSRSMGRLQTGNELIGRGARIGCLVGGSAWVPSFRDHCGGASSGQKAVPSPVIFECHCLSTIGGARGGGRSADRNSTGEEVAAFCSLMAGYLPDSALVFAELDMGGLDKTVALHLGGGAGDRSGESFLCLMCPGGPADEMYASAIELEQADACLALVPAAAAAGSTRHTAAPGTPVGGLLGGDGARPSRGEALRGLSPAPAARQTASAKRRAEGARDSPGTTPPPRQSAPRAKAKASSARGRQQAADPSAAALDKLTSLFEGVISRLDRLEQQDRGQPITAPEVSPMLASSVPAELSGPCQTSMLSRGRIPLPGPRSAPLSAAGDRAYASA